MPSDQQNNEDEEKESATKRRTYHLNKTVVKALSLVAERSPAEAVKSPVVNIALCDELLGRLDIHEDLNLMGQLADIRAHYQRQLTKDEAEGMQRLREQPQPPVRGALLIHIFPLMEKQITRLSLLLYVKIFFDKNFNFTMVWEILVNPRLQNKLIQKNFKDFTAVYPNIRQ